MLTFFSRIKLPLFCFVKLQDVPTYWSMGNKQYHVYGCQTVNICVTWVSLTNNSGYMWNLAAGLKHLYICISQILNCCVCSYLKYKNENKFSLIFFVSESGLVWYSWACDTIVNVVILFNYTVFYLGGRCCMIHFSFVTLKSLIKLNCVFLFFSFPSLCLWIHVRSHKLLDLIPYVYMLYFRF
jgi:hypothetical protein